MKNNNVLKIRDLHISDIDLKTTILTKNFEILSDFIFSDKFYLPYRTNKFSVIGFDFDDNYCIRQIQPMVGYDLFEVLQCAYHDDSIGVHFNILHHDLEGFHYFVY